MNPDISRLAFVSHLDIDELMVTVKWGHSVRRVA